MSLKRFIALAGCRLLGKHLWYPSVTGPCVTRCGFCGRVKE